jgi:lysophospholipase L1-like esterase
MGRVRSFFKILTVNLLVLLVGLIIVELIFGTWFKSTHALHQFTKPRNLSLVAKNPLGDTPEYVRYTRDENGFRGLDAPLDKIDIITVGGSTTDQRHIDDSQIYERELKRLFAAEGRHIVVANAGIDGQSTIGHIQNFPSWFELVPGLRTRYILFYIGINDLMRTEPRDYADKVKADTKLLRLQLYVREKSVFYQIYLIAKYHFQPAPYSHGLGVEYIANGPNLVTEPRVTNYYTTELLGSVKGMQHRIRELDALTRKLGARSIFVTQRSSRWDRQDGRLVGVPDYNPSGGSEFEAFGKVNGIDIFNIEKIFADATMDACKSLQGICINLMEDIQFNLDLDFYDPVHPTASGAKVIGEYLYRKLRDRI